jgi:3-hydroxybutyryl-CoA dehydrogenase
VLKAMFNTDPRRAYMMPAHFGPLHLGGKATGWYRDVTTMVISYVTEREVLQDLLPEPFTVGDEALITVFYARNRDVDWLAGHGYNMISVAANVVFDGVDGPLAGTYSLVIWENLTDPILTGRELQGIPKIYADIPDHSVDDGVWRCSASHFGNRIVDLSIQQLRTPTAAEIELDAKNQEGKNNPMGWRFLPGVGGAGTALSEPTLFPSETQIDEVQVGEGAIKWNHLTWEQNPTQYHIVNRIAALPVLEYRPAVIARGSVNLAVPGRYARALKPRVSSMPVATAAARVPNQPIQRICFFGAGTMGCFNSLVAAISGYEVALYDKDTKTLEQSLKVQLDMAAFLVGSAYCVPSLLAGAFARIRRTSDLTEALADVDLVSESVFENLELKREVHAQLDKLCSPNAILTTNTSSLLVSDIESAITRGERFAALHSHLGAPLVDIVGGSRTSAATIKILEAYVRSLNGIPLVLKREHRGYVFNAMIGPLLATAMALVIEQKATIEEVDRAWMSYRHAPMGPFGMMDLFGINVVYDSRKGDVKSRPQPDIQEKITGFLSHWVDRGALGMKTGEGFYTYPNPAYSTQAFLGDRPTNNAAGQAMTLAILENAVLLAAKEVAEPTDIDRAWMATTTLSEGPFGILDDMGIDTFLLLFEETPDSLASGDRETVRDYLTAFVARGALGVKTDSGFYEYPEPLFQKETFVRGSR